MVFVLYISRIQSVCLALVFALVFASLAAQAQESDPCGPGAPCVVETGDYHLLFPSDWDGESPLPALMFFHGHRSSGESVFRSTSLKSVFSEAGYLIIAPNGAIRPDTDVRAWPARPTAQDVRDDVAFSLSVLDDVAENFPIDPTRIYAAGFSAGGSMAWMIACYASERFAGFVSIAGALRHPVPDGACSSAPARLLHIHGFSDKQVPLEGRAIRDWHQGDVFASFSLLRATNQCRSNPDDVTLGPRYRCRNWTSCENGALRMCIHDGGHGLPQGWAEMARTWLESFLPD